MRRQKKKEEEEGVGRGYNDEVTFFMGKQEGELWLPMMMVELSDLCDRWEGWGIVPFIQ